MNQLFVKKIKGKKSDNIKTAGHLLETQAISNPVQIKNWKDYSYIPQVSFRIGHISDEIWLKFYVTEKHILAKETRTNGAVHKDTCVEFFISPDRENYYNFEFNGIGTTHLAFGADRHNRRFVPEETVEKIETLSTLGSEPFEEKSGQFEWEIMIRIPLKCFAFTNLKSFDGLKATGNFYKCGDDTSQPHYITWNPVKTENPDYHRPEFFGRLEFE
jgi:hypothetical protein